MTTGDALSPRSKGTPTTRLFDRLPEARETEVNPNPLDESEEFEKLCDACRRGDMKTVQYYISLGTVNLNAVDRFDYLPLTLASLCGHYEVCQLLLENGALCERNFQGERTLYSALNIRIRDLLLKYDYSKASDPLRPWADGISALLSRPQLDTTDVTIHCASQETAIVTQSFRLHKFLLAAFSPYFQRKLSHPSTTSRGIHTVRLSPSVSPLAFSAAIKFLYLSEVPELSSDSALLDVERLSRYLELPGLFDLAADPSPRNRRQKRRSALEKAQAGLDAFFTNTVLANKRPHGEPIPQNNPAFADIVLASNDPDPVLYPVHRAMLRSDYFMIMFSSPFRESRRPEHPDEPLPAIELDISAPVLELILRFFYSEKVVPPLEHVLELLYAADSLLIDRLKTLCAQAISTTGNTDDLPYSIYDVILAGWNTRIRRLEEFGARYIAERLEHYIEEEGFKELVAESAERIKERQETDTIEIVDDVRYFLDQRFRMRMEEVGIREVMMSELGIKEKEGGGVSENIREEVKETEDKDKVAERVEKVDEKGEEDFMGREEAMYRELLGKIDTLLADLRLDA